MKAKNKILHLTALVGFVLLFGCTSPQREVVTAFYFWQTKVEPSALEQAWCDSLSVQKLYVRLFDVVWEGNATRPVAVHPTPADAPKHDGREWVPVVFITNESLVKTPESEIGTLANRMAEKMLTLTAGWEVREWQLDCDWTVSTRSKYFSLIRLLKQHLGGKWSATIRLHQVKYREETGVPPVDRGVLMYYNMGDLSEVSTSNSILDLEVAARYHSRLPEYPLALDLALPLFSWGVVFRGNRPIHLLEKLNEGALSDTSLFANKGNHWYQFRKSTYLEGYYGYQNDSIRIESVSPEDLLKAAKALQPLLPSFPLDTFSLIFYHLDERVLSGFEPKDLRTLLRIW